LLTDRQTDRQTDGQTNKQTRAKTYTFSSVEGNYEIMPATLANIFLFKLQGSAIAYWVCGSRFRLHLVAHSMLVCE